MIYIKSLQVIFRCGSLKITSSDFQTATSEKKFIDIMNEAKEKDLGTYKKSTLKTEKITRGLFSNDEITLIYFSEYSKRIVQEVFVFNVEDKKVKLKGYRYDSIN
ncbi:type IV secretion protein Rhs [Escherichia coli]